MYLNCKNVVRKLILFEGAIAMHENNVSKQKLCY